MNNQVYLMGKGSYYLSLITHLERLREQKKPLRYRGVEYTINRGEVYLVKCDKNKVNLTIPEGVVHIYKGAFNGCGRLGKIVIPSTMKRLELAHLSGLKGSVTIFIPLGVNLDKFLQGSLIGCNFKLNIEYSELKRPTEAGDSLDIIKKVKLLSLSGIPIIIDGVRYYFNTVTKQISISCADNNITELRVPYGVNRVLSFRGCDKLKVVELPDTVTYIEDYAFADCVSLNEIKLSKGLSLISNGCFAGCISLSRVVLPEYLHSLGVGAFSKCKSLIDVKFNYNLGYLDESCFSGCISLRKVDLSKTKVSRIEKDTFKDCISLVSCVLSDSVVSIGERAFKGCYTLYQVKLSSILKSLGRECFAYCSSMYEIELPTVRLSDIGDSAFYACSSLRRMYLPSRVKVVGNNAFGYCERLESIEMRGLKKVLGSNLIEGVSNLKSIYIWCDVDIKKDSFNLTQLSNTRVYILNKVEDKLEKVIHRGNIYLIDK